jgi:hypothetical protein
MAHVADLAPIFPTVPAGFRAGFRCLDLRRQRAAGVHPHDDGDRRCRAGRGDRDGPVAEWRPDVRGESDFGCAAGAAARCGRQPVDCRRDPERHRARRDHGGRTDGRVEPRADPGRASPAGHCGHIEQPAGLQPRKRRQPALPPEADLGQRWRGRPARRGRCRGVARRPARLRRIQRLACDRGLHARRRQRTTQLRRTRGRRARHHRAGQQRDPRRAAFAPDGRWTPSVLGRDPCRRRWPAST